MPHVTTKDHVRLYVKDWGTGRPVIMMHGWPLSADTFDDLAMAVAGAGLRAIAYDRRGFGRSDQPWGGYDYDTLADDLGSIISEYVGAQDATILGFSMGGGEVARYMSRHGGKGVKQAILVASVVPYMLKTADNPKGVDQSVFDAAGKAIKEDRAKFWSGFFKDFYGAGTLSQPVSDEVLEWSRDVSMQAGLNATLGCAKAFASTDFRPDLAVVPRADADHPRHQRQDGPDRHLGPPGGRRHCRQQADRYEGAPHGLLASHKDRLIADVLRFVRN